jgi:hypothetical protein
MQRQLGARPNSKELGQTLGPTRQSAGRPTSAQRGDPTGVPRQPVRKTKAKGNTKVVIITPDNNSEAFLIARGLPLAAVPSMHHDNLVRHTQHHTGLDSTPVGGPTGTP